MFIILDVFRRRRILYKTEDWMEGRSKINKKMIPNKRIFIGKLSFYSFWTDFSEDFPSFFRVKRFNEESTICNHFPSLLFQCSLVLRKYFLSCHNQILLMMVRQKYFLNSNVHWKKREGKWLHMVLPSLNLLTLKKEGKSSEKSVQKL